jgi:hypothetical protein
MTNEKCQVTGSSGMCNRPAVGILIQTTPVTSAVPSKTISTRGCEAHAAEMEATTGPHTVERF